MLAIVKILTVLSCLVVASVYDLKYKEVPNKLWIFFLPGAFTFMCIEKNITLPAGISILFTFLIVYALYVLGNGKAFGGADVKAAVVIALFFPVLFQGLPIGYLVFMIAALIMMFYVFVIERKGLNSEVTYPFMPFLTIAFLCFTIIAM